MIVLISMLGGIFTVVGIVAVGIIIISTTELYLDERKYKKDLPIKNIWNVINKLSERIEKLENK